MKSYSLGYTQPGDQAFTLPMTPALLKITAATKAEGLPLPIGTLAANFAAEPAANVSADPALFKAEPLHYSVDFQVAQLQQSPATNAVLEKYLPKSVPRRGGITVLPLAALPRFVPSIGQDQIQAMQAELEKIPVQ
jgi:hypothetical protein